MRTNTANIGDHGLATRLARHLHRHGVRAGEAKFRAMKYYNVHGVNIKDNSYDGRGKP